ncbi:MAG TPA: PaaI family thioesterase [Burkholderiaceae bacterium]|nr:PaaI family thioesterase [Burkholderiaceae bacterium]HSB98862.1 PaaI family thioesterase [Burkholderiaceae bacterium]
MKHPFAEHIAMTVAEQRSGYSRLTLQVAAHHLNPHGVVHGAVLFALADTGMGSALYPTLAAGESCATIEVKINYFKPVHQGTLSCETTIVNRGRSIANLESRVWLDGQVVASANGHYAILRSKS